MSLSQRKRLNLPLRILFRLMTFALAAFMVAKGIDALAHRFNADPAPAGLGRGMIQGALMPMSLPNLLFGNDVTIYSDRNNGVPYKLGYALGVNVCGAIFFGLVFWRLNRLRTKRADGDRQKRSS